jgi:NAD(P)-dependent dehydrogenase (short-subunit alcohol dehydrogenase family)
MTTPRTVLVTGGNRGIGHTVAAAFVAAGHRVAVTSRSGTGGPEGALTVQADITDTASVDAAFTAVEAELGPVEVVIANAGITNDQLLLRMSEEDFTSVVDTNLIGTFRVVKRATKGMMRAKFGRIVLMSSVVGMIGQTGQVNYAASKSALIGMARSITRELGSRGITANVVTPGFIETDMTGELSDEIRKQFEGTVPAGRMGTPEDVAAVCEFLASDGAAYVSGAIVPVDGGLGMGH